ncbi:MAG: hypothetical protein DMF89_08495, partial [Acidobacteria bacterium]
SPTSEPPRQATIKDLAEGARLVRQALELLGSGFDGVCRDCQAPFLLQPDTMLWFWLKNLELPRRCVACRGRHDGLLGELQRRPGR